MENLPIIVMMIVSMCAGFCLGLLYISFRVGREVLGKTKAMLEFCEEHGEDLSGFIDKKNNEIDGRLQVSREMINILSFKKHI